MNGGTSHSDPITTHPAGTHKPGYSPIPPQPRPSLLHAKGTKPLSPHMSHPPHPRQTASRPRNGQDPGRRYLKARADQDMRRLQRGRRAREKSAPTSCRGSSRQTKTFPAATSLPMRVRRTWHRQQAAQAPPITSTRAMHPSIVLQTFQPATWPTLSALFTRQGGPWLPTRK